ncbi:MAG: adenylate/guanylate cyclase domain-containing protein [Maribacter sp.]|uniref:adenylate/guanylate cyclase domain-containing protein n=1 Tax=Maribacter sp. TaxID=1897614 RepID=UPI003C775200
MPYKKKACILLAFFFMFCSDIYSQNQAVADSLERTYTSGNFKEKDRLKLLKDLAAYHPDPEKSLQFSEELLREAKALDSTNRIIEAYLQKGNALNLKGDLTQALESYYEGVKLAEAEESDKDLALFYIAMAAVYSGMGNTQNTIRYYKNGIKIFKERGDSLLYATSLENLGDEYNLNLAKPDSALLFFKESGPIFKAFDNKIGMAYNLGNMGLAYAQLGQNTIAEENISGAISLLEELGDYYPICVYLTYMADMYVQRDDLDAAFGYAERSLELAQQFGLKDQISDANLKLSELYEKKGDAAASLKYYKRHITFRDSVKNITDVQNMANLEVARKQVEVDLLNQKQENQRIVVIATAIALFLIGLLAFGLYRRNRFIRKTKQIIEEERDRSDTLLLNVLPKDTADELKENGKVVAKKFESVTVLFTDFKGFTHYSENLDPEKLVETIGFYFSKFDDIMEKYGLEKIKTIGDSYMCAGGLPYPTKDHAHKMVLAAFEIMDFVKEAKKNSQEGQIHFDTRIGINTGMVVAGVVGSKKFSYDIWGDTVNVASRMETMAEPGRINVSANTYELIKDIADVEYRGEIQVKNRGMMKMFYVNAIKNGSHKKDLVNK